MLLFVLLMLLDGDAVAKELLGDAVVEKDWSMLNWPFEEFISGEESSEY